MRVIGERLETRATRPLSNYPRGTFRKPNAFVENKGTLCIVDWSQTLQRAEAATTANYTAVRRAKRG
jgi:hypothetical protein